jgi:type I restriction enzyme S subunit
MKKWKKISDYLFFQEGPGVRNHQYATNGVKLLNVANLVNGRVDLTTSERYISNEEAYGKYKHFLADEGDLIIASSGIKVDYFDKKMGFIRKEHLPICMNTSTIRLKSLDKNKLDINYFMYYLKSQSFKDQLSKQITGSAQLNFGPSHLKKMEFPIVDIEEQSSINSVLGNIQNQIRLKEEQLTEYEQLIKSRFVEMFGDIRSNSRALTSKSGKDLFKFSSGKFLSEDKRYNSGIPVYGGNGIAWYTDNPLIKHSTLIIGRVGAYCGNVQLVEEPVWITDNAIYIKEFYDDSFNLDFLFEMMKIIDFSRFADYSGQPKITQKPLEDMQYLIPKRQEQEDFSLFVKQIDKLKFEVQKSLSETQMLFDALMQEYFG